MVRFSLKKQAKSFKAAFRGSKQLIHEHNAYIHAFVAVCVIFAGFVFQVSSDEWISIIVAIGLVFTAELFNTAIEKLVDFISPEYNKKAGKIKDIAASAVLCSAMTAAIIGGIIFFPKIFTLFFT